MPGILRWSMTETSKSLMSSTVRCRMPSRSSKRSLMGTNPKLHPRSSRRLAFSTTSSSSTVARANSPTGVLPQLQTLSLACEDAAGVVVEQHLPRAVALQGAANAPGWMVSVK